MRKRQPIRIALLFACAAAVTVPASAQIVEAVGSRALGMGGAFVAVASDGSATWWNPGGLGAGPFLDLALAKASTEVADGLPAWRHRVSWFAVGTPPVGFGYYRFRITDIRPFDSTDQGAANREDRGAGVLVRSLAASQLGVTLVQTLIPGVHAGTTFKYLRGTLRRSREDGLVPPGELLELGEGLEDGDAEGQFDLDIGVVAVAGPLRVGAVVRNIREPEFVGRGQAIEGAGLRLPRQIRMGVAFDPERETGVPLTIALDADLRPYATTVGERRVIAVGGEQWFLAKRFAIRAGGRFNTVGSEERSATGGLSIAARSGVYVDGHVVRGGSADEEGWGLAARVSF